MRFYFTLFKQVFLTNLVWLFWASVNTTNAQVTYIGAWKQDDYVSDVLRSALEHTEEKYGSIALQTRRPASATREESMVRAQPKDKRIALTTMVRRINADPDLIMVPVPMKRGIVGYRICFSSEELAPELAKVESLEQLKGYTFGVGSDWYDRQILDSNHLKNLGVGYNFLFDEQMTSLYSMTTLGRVDILCRGINEVQDELKRYPITNKTVLNNSFALHYDIPFFIYMHKSNAALRKRLTEGLETIHKNGIFQKLWESQFQESIQFANMADRKIIQLNGGDTGVPITQYEKYLYRP